MNAAGELRRTESPIEALLVRAITDEVRRCKLNCRVSTQARIGQYRADIFVQMDDRKLIVECDGAAFHAANKDQVERDKRRDRYFVAQNISVMRFTGAEISRSPRACAAEVGSWLDADPSARKAAIMSQWERGDISRLEACRRIRREGLANA